MLSVDKSWFKILWVACTYSTLTALENGAGCGRWAASCRRQSGSTATFNPQTIPKTLILLYCIHKEHGVSYKLLAEWTRCPIPFNTG